MHDKPTSPYSIIFTTAICVAAEGLLIYEYLDSKMNLLLYVLVGAAILVKLFEYYNDYFDELEEQSSDYLESVALANAQIKAGGFNLKLEDVLDKPEAVEPLQILDNNVSEWADDFLRKGLPLYIRPYSQEQIIKILSEMHNAPLTEAHTQDNEKMRLCLTISSIVYGFKIPMGSVDTGDDVAKYLHQYLVLTRPVSKETVLQKAQIKYPFHNAPVRSREERLVHEELVACIPNAMRYIKKSCESEGYRSKNFYIVREIIFTNSKLYPDGFSARLHKLDDTQLRQVFTMAYLSIGLHVPMDYLSVDDFVLDYVMKNERYHKFTKPTLSLVTPITNDTITHTQTTDETV